MNFDSFLLVHHRHAVRLPHNSLFQEKKPPDTQSHRATSKTGTLGKEKKRLKLYSQVIPATLCGMELFVVVF